MDSYIYMITALLPLVAAMLVSQTNPFHALVIRGILGAIAALTYAMLGAADVALTEALVGTLLAITLYAIAVRSSLVLRLGVLKEAIAPEDLDSPEVSQFQQLVDSLRRIFSKWSMQVELVPYLDEESLREALLHREVHATCLPGATSVQPFHTTTRLRRIYEILQAELDPAIGQLTHLNPTPVQEKP